MTQFSSKISWANLHINTGFISLKCINRNGNINMFERGTADKRMIHVSRQEEAEWHEISAQLLRMQYSLKLVELFIFESFHLRFSLWVDRE